MESIVKVPEKAVAFEELSNNLLFFAVLSIAFSLFMGFGASIFMSGLIDMSGSQVTYDVIDQVMSHATLLLSTMTVFVMLGFFAGGLAFYLKWKISHEMGCVLGVADVEIAVLEKRIRKELERNTKNRAKAQKQIETINEIQKRAEEKKLVEPGQAAP